MSKKQKTKTIEVEEPTVLEVTVEPTKEQLKELVAEEKPRERKVPSNEWEIKDRIYLLKNKKKDRDLIQEWSNLLLLQLINLLFYSGY